MRSDIGQIVHIWDQETERQDFATFCAESKRYVYVRNDAELSFCGQWVHATDAVAVCLMVERANGREGPLCTGCLLVRLERIANDRLSHLG